MLEEDTEMQGTAKMNTGIFFLSIATYVQAGVLFLYWNSMCDIRNIFSMIRKPLNALKTTSLWHNLAYS